MIPELQEFIVAQSTNPWPKSLWFEEGPDSNEIIRVFVRAGISASYDVHRNPMKVLSITISNITIREDCRRRGIFTQLVDELVTLGRSLGYLEFQIENAISQEMISYCNKHNMSVKKSEYGSSDSYYFSMERNLVV